MLDRKVNPEDLAGIRKICWCMIETESEYAGIVVDEELAKRSPCERVEGTNLTYSKGIVGALSPEQREKYCPMEIPVQRPALREHQKRFKEAVKTCRERTQHLTGAERVKAYIECMEEEAKEE